MADYPCAICVAGDCESRCTPTARRCEAIVDVPVTHHSTPEADAAFWRMVNLDRQVFHDYVDDLDTRLAASRGQL